MALSAGTRLGPYEVLAPLGAGGMGEVYRAKDTRLGREVALKVVHPGLASDPDRLSRFEKEARAAAQLDHPNILVVHDVGTHEGSPFIVSELLQGESLREKLGAPLPPKKAVDFAIQIAHGLAAAHEKGIVHRDVKPENVFVTKDGHVKILDFGVAKLLPSFEASGVDTETPTASATQPGTTVGTVAYMSPEQIRGQPVDARTDLFSLGVVLYEMLSGKRPFQRETAAEIMTAILREEPPSLAGTTPAIPPSLEGIVIECLEKQPADRFSSAHDLALALQAAGSLKEEAPNVAVAAPPPAGPARRRRITGLAVAGIAVLAAGMLVLRLKSAGPSARPAGPSIAVLPFTNLSEDKGQEYFSDGLSEEVMGLLTRVKDLKVTGRTSSFAFKGKSEDLRSIGQKLNVTTVLEGSVRRSGDQLRVSTQLVNVADGYQIWAETYDRKLTDIFAVQDEIAGAVVAALKVTLIQQGRSLLPQGRSAASGHHTSNLDAYNQYLLGRQFSNRSNFEGFRRAQECYANAIALDPGYAAAYAGLAIAAFWLSENAETASAQAEGRQKALAAANRAIALDRDLAEGYSARGYLRSTITWDWAGAQADFQRAFSLDPGDSSTLRRHSDLLAIPGRLPEAIAATRKATALDPLSASAWLLLGRHLNADGQLPEARKALTRALEINPERNFVHFHLGVTSLLDGKPKGALVEFEQEPERATRLSGKAMAHHDLEHAKESQQALDELIAKEAQGAAYQIAWVYAWGGERDKAFEWLDRSYAQRDAGLPYLMSDPLVAKLRDDPRYAAMLKRMNLPAGK
jgi:serine/threonine-protein kinase